MIGSRAFVGIVWPSVSIRSLKCLASDKERAEAQSRAEAKHRNTERGKAKSKEEASKGCSKREIMHAGTWRSGQNSPTCCSPSRVCAQRSSYIVSEATLSNFYAGTDEQVQMYISPHVQIYLSLMARCISVSRLTLVGRLGEQSKHKLGPATVFSKFPPPMLHRRPWAADRLSIH